MNKSILNKSLGKQSLILATMTGESDSMALPVK